ncbi:hypothetical protein HB848_00540 [Listeria rocourtiae]|uniref:sensor histidine kinase n=1 Tax=Listeria rocourtiae TaxID=647910 RepID=UPI0016297B7E|nr:hypothetical protein [Listeria rocourtiae]MBC1433822.1 hypothetical protein [Listeria rocourtiae]
MYLKWKNASWLMAFIAPIAAQFLMILVNYVLEWFVLNSFGININKYDAGVGEPIVSMFLMITVCNILVYLMSLLVERLIRQDAFRNTMYSNGYIMSGLLFIALVIIYLFIYLERLFGLPRDFIIVNTVLFVVLFLSICVVFIVMLKIGREQAKQIRQEQEVAQLNDYMEKLEMLYNQMSLFKHDYINILASLQGYIAQGDIDQIENYFNETIKPLRRYN